MATITATNVTALRAKRGLDQAQALFDDATLRLSTGLRVRDAADDPGAFSIGARMKARLLSLERTQVSVQTDLSLVQTAQDGIDRIIDALQKIRELALASASSTATTNDRKANQEQVNDLIAEINRIANNTFFNGRSLLDGSIAKGRSTLFFQVGPDAGANNRIAFNVRTMTAAALGVNDVNVTTESAALNSLDDIDSAIDVSSLEAAKVGGKENRLNSADANLSDQILNHNAALSALLDADLAQAAIDQAKGALLRDTSASALTQANLFPGSVLRVILPGLSS